MYKGIFNGKQVSLQLKKNIRDTILRHKYNLTLGIIQVGDDAMSFKFIKSKIQFAYEVNVNVVYKKFPESYPYLSDVIDQFNLDPSINGYLIQLPIVGLNDKNFLNKIDPLKDIDCLTQENYKKLFLPNPKFIPGVFLAFKHIFEHLNVNSNMKVLLIGKGFVGKPILHYFQSVGYKVDVVDKDNTKDLKNYSSSADIIIFTAGVSNLIGKNNIKKDTFLINIGASANFDGSISGGISDDVASIAEFFVPSIGGIGPLTIAMLFENLIKTQI